MNDARRSGLTWIGAGAMLAAVWMGLVLSLDSRGWSIYGPALGLPVVPLLVGFTQVASGRYFGELARAWDSLAGWQRLVLGLVIVSLAGTIIVVGIGLALAIIVG